MLSLTRVFNGLKNFFRILLPRTIVLWIIVTLTFMLMKALPGDPFADEQALPEEIHSALRHHYGLDDPWPIQYWRYIKSSGRFDFGPSFRYPDRTVNDIIKQSFPISAILGFEALALALCGGILLGAIAAIRSNAWPDRLSMFLIALGVSIPSFLLATWLQYFLGLKLGILPIARWGTFEQTILPALSLAALPMAFIARLTRSSLMDVLKQDYIKNARAKGLSEGRIILSHALRNALLPVLTYLGPLTANVLVGSFIIEKIFAIPGLGQWFVNSVGNRDYTLIMGTTVFYSVILMGMIAIVDFAYVILDPRMRKSLHE